MKSSLDRKTTIFKENNESNFKSKIDKKNNIFLENSSQKEKTLIIYPKLEKIPRNIFLEKKHKNGIIFELNINFPFDKQKLNNYLQELKNLRSQKNLKKHFFENSKFININEKTPILHIKNLIEKNNLKKNNIEEEPLLRFENLKKKEVMEKIFFREIKKLKKFWNDEKFTYPFIFRKIEDFNKNETIDISHKEILINKNK